MLENGRMVSMPDPTADAELRAHADRLRALEDQFAARYGHRPDDGLDGIREYSRAWHENRTTSYLLRKSWADPVNRWFLLLTALGIALILSYLILQ
jgi:hypothetical protein